MKETILAWIAIIFMLSIIPAQIYLSANETKNCNSRPVEPKGGLHTDGKNQGD